MNWAGHLHYDATFSKLPQASLASLNWNFPFLRLVNWSVWFIDGSSSRQECWAHHCRSSAVIMESCTQVRPLCRRPLQQQWAESWNRLNVGQRAAAARTDTVELWVLRFATSTQLTLPRTKYLTYGCFWSLFPRYPIALSRLTHEMQEILWSCRVDVRPRRGKPLQSLPRRSSSEGWSAAAVWTCLLSVLLEEEKTNNKDNWMKPPPEINHAEKSTTKKQHLTWSTVTLWDVSVCCCNCCLLDLSPTYLPGPVWLEHNFTPVRLCFVSGWKLVTFVWNLNKKVSVNIINHGFIWVTVCFKLCAH